MNEKIINCNAEQLRDIADEMKRLENLPNYIGMHPNKKIAIERYIERRLEE